MKTNNLHAQCQYLKEILLFKNHIEKSFEIAMEEEANGNEEAIQALYNEPITISFNGKTLELELSPNEFENIVNCLESIVEEA